MTKNSFAGSRLLQLLNDQAQNSQSLQTRLELKKKIDVGEKLAAAIISERKKKGGFQTLQDVLDIKGIGYTLLSRMLEAMGESMLLLSRFSSASSGYGCVISFNLNIGGALPPDEPIYLNIYPEGAKDNQPPIERIPVSPDQKYVLISLGSSFTLLPGHSYRAVLSTGTDNQPGDGQSSGHFSFSTPFLPLMLIGTSLLTSAGNDGAQESEDQKIQELLKAINQLLKEKEMLIEALNFFPTLRLVNLLNKSYNIISIMYKTRPIVIEVLVDFLACRNEALVKLTVEQLKSLVELLLALTELEIETCEDAEMKTKLENWLEQLKQALKNWDFTDKNKKAAVQAVQALKDYLIKFAPDILKLLAETFNEEIKKAINDFLLNIAEGEVGKQLRKIAERIVEKILNRAFGKAVAGKIIPFMGTLMALMELTAIIEILKRIVNKKALIDQVLYELLELLTKSSAKYWPDFDVNPVLLFSKNEFTGITVTIQPYLVCGRINANKIVTWSKKPCKIKFADKSGKKTITLGPNNLVKGMLEVSAGIDKNSVTRSACMKQKPPPDICYIYYKITYSDAKGKLQTTIVIGGVKKMK